ncbi:peptidase inhibitor family I36 protein [Streptomyces sp. XM4193]|uniref:peptidase inhibitor family I36 protein n=1 Tax=Streptomyces sp. XM4193 TaxID=2929782 RepID=UPI0035ABFDC7
MARLLVVIVWTTATLFALPGAARAGSPPAAECAAGELCLWPRADYGGPRTHHELLGLTTEECTPLPKGTTAGSLVNRTGRPVTVYQSAVCDTTGDFSTYPSGSWVPEAPYTVRAFTLWER